MRYNGYVGKTQLAALQATLAQLNADATVTHIFCFMHRPIKDKGGSQIGGAKGDTSPYATQVRGVSEDAGQQQQLEDHLRLRVARSSALRRSGAGECEWSLHRQRPEQRQADLHRHRRRRRAAEQMQERHRAPTPARTTTTRR